MHLEIFQIVTPYVTLVLAVGVGAIGWFVRRLIEETQANFADLKYDLGKRIEKVEVDIEKLESARSADQKYLYEHCVQKEVFYMTVGETKGLIGKVFDELKEVNRLVNQTIGGLNLLNRENND